MLCNCMSGQEYQDCCKKFIEDKELPKTAEQLMRSRYTAYSKNNIAYIVETMQGKAAKDFDEASASQWTLNAKWQGLRVISSQTLSPEFAFVEFIARYSLQGKNCFIHERSKFQHIHDRWYYISGELMPIGRNDFCPCGSSHKYKKCCG